MESRTPTLTLVPPVMDEPDTLRPGIGASGPGLIQAAGWPWPNLVDAPPYERQNSPEGWQPYPDAVETLSEAKDRGLATALISNISFGVRPHLARAGLDYLDTVVLSYEVGLIKPDPRIFALACDKLGVDPARAVMVGDHAADGGGRSLGVRTFLVELLPVAERPEALINVLWEITA